MDRPRILTLTTDFGNDGPYVAAMKGVVLGLVPGAQLVDVSHSVAPQNILEGAFVLAEVFDAFPPGTVHLAVVDPGVGTARRLIAASVGGQWVVLPDNGLITGVVRSRAPDGVWEIQDPVLGRSQVSATFHGRDILAPAAAYLLGGGDPERLGPRVRKLVTLRNFVPIRDEQGYLGEVVFRDTFGNLVTNIAAEQLSDAAMDDWVVEIAGARVTGLGRAYGDHPTGSLIALPGSTGWIEVAIVNGDAARHLAAGPGATVWIRRKS